MAKRKYKARYQPPETMTKLEAALRLVVSISTIEQMIRDGRLVSVMPERKRFVTVASVEAIEAERREKIRAAIAKTEVAMITGVTPDGQ